MPATLSVDSIVSAMERHRASDTGRAATRDEISVPASADAEHAHTVYVNNLQIWRSTDGGTSFTEILTPHGDNHDLWIDPAEPNRMVQGNDGGANVSFNGGETWTTVYNQQTAQFYRIAVDDNFPYVVYGTQQDNTAIAVPNAAPWGAITLGDCFYPGSGESGFGYTNFAPTPSPLKRRVPTTTASLSMRIGNLSWIRASTLFVPGVPYSTR